MHLTRTIAQLCKASYLDPPENARRASQLGFNVVKFFPGKQGTQAYIYEDKNIIALVYRGTDEIKDWLKNLTGWKISVGEGVRVHKGFYQVLMSDPLINSEQNPIRKMVYTEIYVCLLELLKKNRHKKLIISGHSLGGALAQMFTFFSGLRPHMVITFGQPRVGNYKFKKEYDKMYSDITLRFVNNADLVPTIPRFLYFHTKQYVGISQKKLKFKRNIVDSTIAWIKRMTPPWHRGLRDHWMGNYEDRTKDLNL